MKQIIRLNTFETNSSSMHSLVVVKNPIPYSTFEKELETYSKESFDLFGWNDGYYERYPFQVLRTPKDKLRYFVAHYIGACGQKELIPKVIKFIANQLNIKEDKINICVEDEDSYRKYGYAGSNDTGEDPFNYIEQNNIALEEFILNPKYIIIVDGDEYQEFAHLIDSGIINLDDFEFISSGKDFWDPKLYSMHIHWFIDDELFQEVIADFNLDRYNRIEIQDDDDEKLSQSIENLKWFLTYIETNRNDLPIKIKTNRKNGFINKGINCNYLN